MNQHELDIIVKAGESNTVEFKRNVNSDISRKITAFANSSGGRLFVGIEDDGSIHGVSVTNELKARVESMARECDPPAPIELEVFNGIMIIHVPEGKDKPYRCTNGFYIRAGASCSKLSTQEIREFLGSEGKLRFDEMYNPSVIYPAALDEAAIHRFTRLSGISDVIGRDELLTNLGVLINKGSGLTLNYAGVMFFAKQPAMILPHGVVTCLLFKGNEKVHILDRKSFEFDMLTNIDEALLFLKRHLNLAYEIKEVRRKEILDIPEFVLREAIINAVAHRDYFEKGANVQVDIFDNRVTISNPGGLPKGLKPENFGLHSVARNSLVASLLHRCDYIEKAGTGIKRMRDGMKNAGLLPPTFEFSTFFTVILKRNRVNAFSLANDFKVSRGRMDRMLLLARQLRDGVEMDALSLATQFNTSSRTIRRDLEILEQHGWIKSIGTTKNKKYLITREGLEIVNELF